MGGRGGRGWWVGGVDVGEAGWERVWQFYELLGRFCCGVERVVAVLCWCGVGFAFGLGFCCWLLRGETEVFVDGMLSLVGTVVKEI